MELLEDLAVVFSTLLEIEEPGGLIRGTEVEGAVKLGFAHHAGVYLAQQSDEAIGLGSASAHPTVEVETAGEFEAIAGFERSGPDDVDAQWQAILHGLPEKLPVSRRQWPLVKLQTRHPGS